MKRIPPPTFQTENDFLHIVDVATIFSCCRRAAMTAGAFAAGTTSAVFSFGDEEKVRPVTSLGWLLRNWKAVHDLHVWTFNIYRGVQPGDMPRFEAVLAARLVENRVYATTFADQDVLAQWLNRPVFKGRPVHWNNRAYIVGSTDYVKDLVHK